MHGEDDGSTSGKLHAQRALDNKANESVPKELVLDLLDDFLHFLILAQDDCHDDYAYDEDDQDNREEEHNAEVVHDICRA